MLEIINPRFILTINVIQDILIPGSYNLNCKSDGNLVLKDYSRVFLSHWFVSILYCIRYQNRIKCWPCYDILSYNKSSCTFSSGPNFWLIKILASLSRANEEGLHYTPQFCLGPNFSALECATPVEIFLAFKNIFRMRWW